MAILALTGSEREKKTREWMEATVAANMGAETTKKMGEMKQNEVFTYFGLANEHRGNINYPHYIIPRFRLPKAMDTILAHQKEVLEEIEVLWPFGHSEENVRVFVTFLLVFTMQNANKESGNPLFGLKGPVGT